MEKFPAMSKGKSSQDPNLSISSQNSFQAEALRFEYTVNFLLKHIETKYGNLKFKFDKNRIMESERIKTVHTRSDGTSSHPDAEGYQGKKILCIDAKNHSKSRIGEEDIKKLDGDTEVRRGRPGILVIHEKGCLTDEAYEICKERDITIIQLHKEGVKQIAGANELDEKLCKKKYLTVKNVNKLYDAIVANFNDVEVPAVLITKDGRIKKTCKAWKDFQKGKTILEEHGVVFVKNSDVVDEKCAAYKKYKEYEKEKKKRKSLSNYDHKAAKERFNEAVREVKANKKLEEAKNDSKSLPTGPLTKNTEASTKKLNSSKPVAEEETKQNKKAGTKGKKHAEDVLPQKEMMQVLPKAETVKKEKKITK